MTWRVKYAVGKMSMAIVAICVIFIIGAHGEKSKEKKAQYYMKQKFVLSSKITHGLIPTERGFVEDTITNLGKIRGEITWIDIDANGFTVDLKVTDIEQTTTGREASRLEKARKQIAEKTYPFVARVSMSKEEEVPLSIGITRGMCEDDHSVLMNQYKYCYGILEMMLVTVVKKEYAVPENDYGASLSVKPVDRVKLQNGKVVSVSKLISWKSPTKFTVFPYISRGKIRGSQISSFAYGKRSVRFFTKVVDNKTGVATRAVVFEGTLKEKSEFDELDYLNVSSLLEEKQNFLKCLLYELEITAVE